MGKSGGKQTVTSSPDQATQERIRQLWQQAQAAGGPIPAGTQGAIDKATGAYTGAIDTGNLGWRALGGDQAAINQMMNPYMSGVVDQVRAGYGDIRADTMNSVNDQATRAGAFGGSRHGVAEGVALGQVAKDEAGRLADLRYQGYGDTMGRAANAANLGLGAAGGLMSVGDYQANNTPEARRYQAMLQAMGVSPSGQTQTTTGTQGRNGLAGLLGGAASGAGIAQALGKAAGPWGWGLTAAGGLLGLV